MAIFRFGLQRVLEMRQEAVTECEQKVEHAYRIREQLKRLLMDERDGYVAERDVLNGIIARSELGKIALFEASLDKRKERLLKILSLLRDVESDIDLLEQTLVNARRDLKVVENLRVRRLQEFNRSEDAKERKFIDEQAAMRFLRRETEERWEGKE